MPWWLSVLFWSAVGVLASSTVQVMASDIMTGWKRLVSILLFAMPLVALIALRVHR